MTGPRARPEPSAALLPGVCVYGLLLLSSFLWLWLRGRLEVVPAVAIGAHGPVASSGLGLAVGCLGASAFRLLSARTQRFREIEGSVRELFGGIGGTAALAFVLTGAIAEEFFFRLAVQDALGLAGAVAAYALLNSSMAGIAWIPVAAVHALVLGALVWSGFGLLASTTAHAVMNYLSLRRILCA